MLLASSEVLSAVIQYGEACLPLSFVMVNVGLLNRHTRLGGFGEIVGMMQSLDRSSRTLGHKVMAGMYLAHLCL